MPQGLSSTCLPACLVFLACGCALDRLESEADDLKVSLIIQQRKTRGWKLWGRPDETVWEQAPGEIKKIVELYRAKDRKVLEALGALAHAAKELNPTFTVVVTADDFRLFSKWFSPLTNGANKWDNVAIKETVLR